jgi:hypothetical protein
MYNKKVYNSNSNKHISWEDVLMVFIKIIKKRKCLIKFRTSKNIIKIVNKNNIQIICSI